MDLKKYPERRETVIDSDLFKEREKSLPENIKRVNEAKKYFLDMETKAFSEPIDIKEVNTGYIHILDDCIEFVENKEKINEQIKKGLNENVYHDMTGRYGYSGTLGVAKHLMNAFFNPKLNDRIRSSNEKSSMFLERDAREQAYRICDYVIRYMRGYAKDHRLEEKTKEEILKILGMQPEHSKN